MCKPISNSRATRKKFIQQAQEALLSPDLRRYLPTHPHATSCSRTDRLPSSDYCFETPPTSSKKGDGDKYDSRLRGGFPHSGQTISKGSKQEHVCKACGKSFKRAHNLKVHGRLHTGARPYKCPFKSCKKDFRWKSSLVSHVNWHRTKLGQELPRGASVEALISRGFEDSSSYQTPKVSGVFGLGRRIDGLGMARIVNASMGFNPGLETFDREGQDMTRVTLESYLASRCTCGRGSGLDQ